MLDSQFYISTHFGDIAQMESHLYRDVGVVGMYIELSCRVYIAETIVNFGFEGEWDLVILVLDVNVHKAFFESDCQLLENEDHLVHWIWLYAKILETNTSLNTWSTVNLHLHSITSTLS